MTTEEVMRERAMLIGWKFSHGLTADEAARLDWLNTEANRLCPTVTPEMWEALKESEQRSTETQAFIDGLREKYGMTPNGVLGRTRGACVTCHDAL